MPVANQTLTTAHLFDVSALFSGERGLAAPLPLLVPSPPAGEGKDGRRSRGGAESKGGGFGWIVPIHPAVRLDRRADDGCRRLGSSAGRRRWAHGSSEALGRTGVDGRDLGDGDQRRRPGRS